MSGMFRWIVDDTRALIADVKALLMRLGTRWQWMRMRSRHRIEDTAADLENVRRGAAVRTRMCRECRALIPVSSRNCPECGERPGRPVTRGIARVAEHMLPGFISASSSILTLNIVLYGLTHALSSALDPRVAGPAGPWTLTLIALGANVPLFVVHGEVWRLLTMVFLHGNLLHLLMNSWALFAVGPLVEELYGPRKFLCFYVVTGICGSLASTWWHLGGQDLVPAIGASGAIFGLIGVAAVWGWRRGGRVGEGIKGQMAQWAMYGLAMGFLIQGTDNAAHVGGLVSGALLALVIGDAAPRTAAGARGWEAIAWLCGLAVLGAFAMVAFRYEAVLQLLTRSV